MILTTKTEVDERALTLVDLGLGGEDHSSSSGYRATGSHGCPGG